MHVQVGTDRDTSTPGSYFQSAECARLNQAIGGQLMRGAPPNSPIPFSTITVSFGFDYVQMYHFKQRSTGIICMR